MILYKYLTPGRVDVLRDRMIRLTQPADFNDPFEFRLAFGDIIPDAIITDYLNKDFGRQVEEAVAKLPPEQRNFARQYLFSRKAEVHGKALMFRDTAAPVLSATVRDKFHELMNTHAGILCLSEVRDSMLMWGHYAEAHKGFVIGFDAEHRFFQQKRSPTDEFGFLRRVVYSSTRPLLTFANVDSMSAHLFHTKSHLWAYEREWRLMRVLGDATRTDPKKPFPICLFEFEPDAVREIIVGMRATPETLGALRRLAGTFPKASLLAAHEHRSAYELVFEELR